MCHLLYDFVRVHRSHSRQIPKYHSTKSLANAIWIMNRLKSEEALYPRAPREYHYS
jgi:hypothetical protein